MSRKKLWFRKPQHTNCEPQKFKSSDSVKISNSKKLVDVIFDSITETGWEPNENLPHTTPNMNILWALIICHNLFVSFLLHFVIEINFDVINLPPPTFFVVYQTSTLCVCLTAQTRSPTGFINGLFFEHQFITRLLFGVLKITPTSH